MKCIIVEDQSPAQRVLKKYIGDLGNLELVGTFSNALDAMEFLKSDKVDLMFLDIHLPKISGMDFLKTIQNPPQVILTTAFSEYAVQSYEHDVLDYLVKPFSFERFVKAVAKFQSDSGPLNLPKDGLDFFIKSGYDYIKLNSRDITHINTDMDYTELHTAEKKHLSNETLSHWEKKLGDYRFTRVHKSYLINLDSIEKVAGNQVYLKNGTSVPIGRAYKDGFLSDFVK